MLDIEQIKLKIINVPDFPKEGVNFKDISELLKSSDFTEIIRMMGNLVEKPKYWVGIESRGFIFASALSVMFGGGILLCRKKNKLPPPFIEKNYQLEYGTDSLSVKPGEGRVIIVDDVIATGGTIRVTEELLKEAGYEVIDKLSLINLKNLNKINDIKSLITYE